MSTQVTARIFSPQTNPVFFRSAGRYDYEEHELYDEVPNCFVQQWHLGDRMTLQFQFENIPDDAEVALRITLNGMTHTLVYWYTGPHPFYPNPNAIYSTTHSGGRTSGTVVFSSIVQQFTDCLLNTPLAFGTHNDISLAFSVTYNGNTLRLQSPVMCVSDYDTHPTKLIKYRWNGYKFGTFWNLTPHMYELRLPATFLYPNEGGEIAVFTNYNGDTELINAHAESVLPIVIGSPNGLPDHLCKTLHLALMCEYLSIGGTYYTLNAVPQYDRVQGYPYSRIAAELKRRDFPTRTEDMAFIASPDTPGTSDPNEDVPHGDTPNEDTPNTGTLDTPGTSDIEAGPKSIRSTGGWQVVETEHLHSDVQYGFGDYAIRVSASNNYSDTDLTETLEVRNVDTGEVIRSISVFLPSNPVGIGRDSIGSTFIVRTENIKKAKQI